MMGKTATAFINYMYTYIEKGPSVKIQLLNIFKDQYIVAK